MRHKRGYRRLNRTKEHRRSLFRNMVSSLLRFEKLETTVEKAKELRPIVEKLITLGSADTLHARRRAYSYVPDKEIVHKLFSDIGPRFRARNGGYTRIIRSKYRHGDAAELAYIELVEGKAVIAPKKKRASNKEAREAVVEAEA
jgi:large subunit ribosomal protein L17